MADRRYSGSFSVVRRLSCTSSSISRVTMNTLCSEKDLTKVLPITLRQLRVLRRTGQIPFVKVNRRTRLYSLERVVAALEKLETKVTHVKRCAK